MLIVFNTTYYAYDCKYHPFPATVTYMRKVLFFTIAVVLSVFLITALSDQLLLFVMIGKIPFVNIYIPPPLMISFWLLLLPSIRFLKNTLPPFFWSIAQLVYEARRRRTRRLEYQRATHSQLDFSFISIYLLYLANQEPSKRKRFLPEFNQNHFAKVFSR